MFSKFDPKLCARCNKMHICTGSIQCPCYEVKVPEKILDFVAAQYDECLCNDCIDELKIENSSTREISD